MGCTVRRPPVPQGGSRPVYTVVSLRLHNNNLKTFNTDYLTTSSEKRSVGVLYRPPEFTPDNYNPFSSGSVHP